MTNKLNIAGVAIALGVLAAIVVSVQPFGAQANSANPSPTVERYFAKVSGKTAWADWYIEEDGIFTNVYVFVSDRTVRSNLDTYPRAVVEASVYQYRLEEFCEVDEYGEEYCYYQEIPIYSFFGDKEVDKSDFEISNSLSYATLNTEVIGYGYYSDDDEDYYPDEEEETISINATWTGFGETFKGRDRYTSSNNYERVTEYGTGFFKQANANIKINGEGVALDLNENSGYGEAHIGKFRNGYFERISYE